VSDARKRALRLFGNALGNCLYDKQHLQKLKTIPKGAQGYLPENPVNPYLAAGTRTDKGKQHVDNTPIQSEVLLQYFGVRCTEVFFSEHTRRAIFLCSDPACQRYTLSKVNNRLSVQSRHNGTTAKFCIWQCAFIRYQSSDASRWYIVC
jgi:hypothetical protein